MIWNMAAFRPPRELDSAGRGAWREAVITLEAIGEDAQLSQGAVRRYCDAVSAWRSLVDEWERENRPVTRLGARGVLRVHPLVPAIASARTAAQEASAVLGLDPLARRRLRSSAGRPPGAASAPDRQVPKRTLRPVAAQVSPLRPGDAS